MNFNIYQANNKFKFILLKGEQKNVKYFQKVNFTSKF